MVPDPDSSICVDILEAIAHIEETVPRDLDFTLQDHISARAVDELHRADRGEWELYFEVPGHDVTVQSDGAILVDDEPIQQDP